ncbi:alkyl/aryl-sulfatase [Paraferrimonas sp. SM1919]|uniref:alkyl/aryl-sulfatase n=1 Tax=Paraferrimonas sp. SM1919 TaxID=2662263 RepID=UPI0013D43413|nr:alkyl sulfatase dimerization domain-containing protein [Paraferrimonas sp. SM1919]
MKYLIPVIAAVLSACQPVVENNKQANNEVDEHGFTAPTQATISLQQRYRQQLTEVPQDWQNATQGLIAMGAGKAADIWEMQQYQFIDGQAPNSVHPSLWRQAKLNNQFGLFKVSDNIYQVRGYDLASMTLLRGPQGDILIDPLTSRETAQVGLDLITKELGDLSLKAVIVSHSHVDHFGGIGAIIDSTRSELEIIAPEGFVDEAVSENLTVGPAMSRRAEYMYGRWLPKSARGHIGSGLGKEPALGTIEFYLPTRIIDKSQTHHIAGLELDFRFVPEAEAPAELVFYMPKQKALFGAEILSHTMHNLYTLRGAKVRDALKWSDYIDDMATEFNDAEIFFSSHHWPIWSQAQIQSFLTKQSDTYRYIHNQSVHLLNRGFDGEEIAEQIQLPDSLNNSYHNQGYYGSLSHNSKAVYQAYMGWFNANPAQLQPLPKIEAATRYVSLMGGVDAIVDKAQLSFTNVDTLAPAKVLKEYRWLAQLLNHCVLAEPEHSGAKQLLAKVYDQLGYLAQSAPWRDFYLSGAYELRHGNQSQGVDPADIKHLLNHASYEQILGILTVNFNGQQYADDSQSIGLVIDGMSYQLSINNGVMRYHKVAKLAPELASITLSKAMLIKLITKEAGVKQLLFADDLEFSGSSLDLIAFFSKLSPANGDFNLLQGNE